jgi:potassium voltage-gated channel subfamily F protein 1
VCPEDLIEELNFWRINPEQISGTCMCTQEIINEDSELESLLDEESIMDDEFKDIRFGDLRQKIWTLIEDPSSSFYAQIFASFSILFVVISIAGLILGSLPELQVPNAQANKTSKGSQI